MDGVDDGLRRARHNGGAAIVERMTAIHADALDWLSTRAGAGAPPTIYLDPMYSGTRRAAAGKAMALLQTFLGPAPDDAELLGAARAVAGERVVVKRHRRAPALAGMPADYTLAGRSTRFDVYRASGGRLG